MSETEQSSSGTISPSPERKVRVHKGDAIIIGGPSNAPTFFTDGLRGIQIKGDAVKLTFIEHLHDEAEGNLVSRYVAHMAMGEKTFHELAAALHRTSEDMKKKAIGEE